MSILQIESTCRSVVGTVGVVATCSRWVLPRSVICKVYTELDEAERLLNRAEAINAIQDEREYRTKLTKYGNPCNIWGHPADRHSIRNKFLRMRMADHRAPGFFQQLRLLFGSTLTYNLYVLSSQIGTIKLQLEVRWITLVIYPLIDGASQLALDEREVSSDIDLECAITVTQPCPAAGRHLITVMFLRCSPAVFPSAMHIPLINAVNTSPLDFSVDPDV